VPLLKKYISYARKFVHPKVGPEANQVDASEPPLQELLLLVIVKEAAHRR
jgi:hypothetical protein